MVKVRFSGFNIALSIILFVSVITNFFCFREVLRLRNVEDNLDKILGVVHGGKNESTASLKKISLSVGKGDTVYTILKNKLSLESPVVAKISKKIQTKYNPKSLKAGDTIECIYDDRGLKEILIITGSSTIHIDATTYSVHKEEVSDISELKYVFFTVNRSVFASAKEAGVPGSIILQFVNKLKSHVDFKRIKTGTKIELLFGDRLKFVSMETSKGVKQLFQCTVLGKRGYYFGDGSSPEFMFHHPTPGASISSAFGMRMHPIKKVMKMHKGVDFGAIHGTNILSIGDGIIKNAGYSSSYGYYIIIKHKGRFESLYAHLNSIAHGIVKGKRVKRGRFIGKVGATGLATGAHLHLELHFQGKHVDPIRYIDAMSNLRLTGDELRRFFNQKEIILQEVRKCKEEVGYAL